jgi:hypothetical protein
VCASPPKSGSSARRTFWGAACLPPSGKVSLSVAGRGERRSEQGVWTKNEFTKRNLQHSTTKKNARSGFRERDTLHHRQCENVTGVNYSEVWSGGAGEQSRHPCFLCRSDAENQPTIKRACRALAVGRPSVRENFLDVASC